MALRTEALRLWSCAALLVLAAAGTAAQKDDSAPALTTEGVYTSEQADRGARTYAERCGACHKIEQFAGPHFFLSWGGQRADSLFNLIRTTMPTGSPASLKRQEYADILAYLLRANGLPAGKTELEGTDAALKRIVIEAPRQSAQSKER